MVDDHLGDREHHADGFPRAPCCPFSPRIAASVNLLGISVDGTRLPIPDGTFVLDPKTGHGGAVAFETSTPAVTLLADPAYNLVVEAFTARPPAAASANVTSSWRPCFLVDPNNVTTVPAMTMHFEAMDMELPWKNYLSTTTGRNNRRGDNVMCLMIGRSTTANSVIGSIMQMDFHVLYDLKNSMLSPGSGAEQRDHGLWNARHIGERHDTLAYVADLAGAYSGAGCGKHLRHGASHCVQMRSLPVSSTAVSGSGGVPMAMSTRYVAVLACTAAVAAAAPPTPAPSLRSLDIDDGSSTAPRRPFTRRWLRSAARRTRSAPS
uniref:Xylanase inhibitor C-terminal domain-containing protein n=1 Tax=Oryza punctata TaxID=4537 RepID=A0A0E0LLM1_ORYPU